jgi:uncharacterized protein YuzE
MNVFADVDFMPSFTANEELDFGYLLVQPYRDWTTTVDLEGGNVVVELDDHNHVIGVNVFGLETPVPVGILRAQFNVSEDALALLYDVDADWAA